MASWQITSLAGHEDRYASVVGESLQYFDRDIWTQYIGRVGIDNFRCSWSQSGDFVGGLAFYRMGQYFGGKAVPCAGVSGVGIDPAYRGSGACQDLLLSTLRELHGERLPLAGLYASTRTLYRSVGFEISGQRTSYSLQMHGMRAAADARSMPVHRTTAPDFNCLAKLEEQRGQVSNGTLRRSPGLWDRVVAPIDRTTSTYLLGDLQQPEGFLTVLHGKRDYGHPQPLVASDWIACTPRAMQRLLALITDHRSMCDCFQWNGGPQDMLMMACQEEHLEVTGHLSTLTRIIHLAEALSVRGYSPEVNAELHFDIQDEHLPQNAGRWILRIENGTPQVEAGGSGQLSLDIRDLATMYTSMYQCTQLAAMGRVQARSDDAIQIADQVFAGPSPWTSEIY